MNLKLLLGIFVPLIVAVALVILSSANIGFSIEKETEKSLEYNKLFTSQSQAGEVKIQTITIKNDYFLPKKNELPKIMVCLYDKEGKVKSQNLYVRYNEGKASEIPEAPIIQELGLAKSSYGYGSYTVSRAVEVPANSQKQVNLMVQPKYSYNRYPNQNYGDYEYDELLILEPNDNYDRYSYSCANLDDKDLDDAVRINIVNVPTVVVAQPAQITTSTQKTTSTFISPYKNISECDKFIDIDKDNCYELVAIAKRDTDICELAVNPTSKSGCYASVAHTSGNYSICDNLPGNITYAKDWCIANTAISLREKSACYKVEYQFARDKCFNSII